jgi:hypothetical protein
MPNRPYPQENHALTVESCKAKGVAAAARGGKRLPRRMQIRK